MSLRGRGREGESNINFTLKGMKGIKFFFNFVTTGYFCILGDFN